MSTCGCGHAVTVHVAYTGGCDLCACVHYRPTGLIAVTTQSHTTETGATR